ncbi:innexin inx2 [Copidosoma floridanum]|uniref:innexin inx2 n=1 Tax=Copidosoma floridanum TaxID=29053 RepID=UPI0006C94056|nr:innexin inx2 [Copidosoma floridanum]
MFDVFGSVKSFIELDKIDTDNIVFKLHYKATFVILLAFSILVTSKQYFGDPIDCIVDEIPSDVMDTYCWIHSTFTVRHLHGIPGRNVVSEGVGPAEIDSQADYHKYYQWVCFVLFFQAILFYVPRYLWQMMEGGKLKMLVLDMNLPDMNLPDMTDNAKASNRKILVDYFITNLNNHNFYAFRFFLCELLNFINVFLQMHVVDRFLDGGFKAYGSVALDNWDVKDEVFPKLTKCTFHKYGPSGSGETFDGLCVLPLNIVNEKIYVFLWFWFWFLVVVNGLNLMYRVCMIVVIQFRVLLLRARSRLNNRKEIEKINCKCQIGDWFMLYQLGRNIDPLIYKQVITDLAVRLYVTERV